MRSLIPRGGRDAPRDDVLCPDGHSVAPTVARAPRPHQTGNGAAVGLGRALNLRRYVAIIRDQWRLVVGVLVVVTGGVAIGNALKQPIYRATATIEIRKQAAEVVPVDAVFEFERISNQYLQTQYALLRSPMLVRRVLSDSVLFARLEAMRSVDPRIRDKGMRAEILVSRVHRGLSVDPVSGSRLVRVSFEATDPVVAAGVVNAVVAQYIGMRQDAGTGALQRFAEQADSMRVRVLQGELHLQQFVRENGLGVIVGASGALENVPQERLRRLQQELTAAETDVFRSDAAYTATTDQTSAAIDSDLLKALRVRIAELQGEYSRLRSAFTDSYPRARQLRSELAQLDSLVRREQERVTTTLTSQHRATQRRRELLRAAVNEQQALMDNLAAKHAEYERLKRDLEGQKALHDVLQQKRKEAAVAAALAVADVAVLDAASPPRSKVSPLPKRDVPLGAIAGLMLGLGLAFVRTHADVTVKTLDEIEVMSDVPVLALIPSVRVAQHGPTPTSRATGLTAAGRHYSFDFLAEAFRGLRTSMLFESTGPIPQTLLITSAAPGDGKTFVSTNLALSMASLGRRVLLIDADLRRPSVHRALGLTGGAGLGKHLAGGIDWQEALTREVAPGLDVLASRSVAPSASDLLSSAATRKLLDEARSSYDLIVVDSPALFINVPDSRILAQMVDGVVLVVRSGATPRALVRRLVSQTPRVVGLVINGYDLRQLPASYAEYGENAVTS